MFDEDGVWNAASLCEPVESERDELFSVSFREVGNRANQP